MPHSHPHSRFGLPSLYLAIFLLAFTGLFAKLIPLNAITIIQLRGIVAALGFALFALLQNRNLRLDGARTYAGVFTLCRSLLSPSACCHCSASR